MLAQRATKFKLRRGDKSLCGGSTTNFGDGGGTGLHGGENPWMRGGKKSGSPGSTFDCSPGFHIWDQTLHQDINDISRLP